MSIADIIDRFVEFSYLLANVLVCALASKAYQDTGKRCLLLIAISAGIGAVLTAAPWIRADEPSWGFWEFHTLATLCDLCFWVVGAFLLFRDYADLVARFAQLDAPPNGGPAEPLGNSGVSGGPPSVS